MAKKNTGSEGTNGTKTKEKGESQQQKDDSGSAKKAAPKKSGKSAKLL